MARQVIVVGGGLAGVSAANAVVQRGQGGRRDTVLDRAHFEFKRKEHGRSWGGDARFSDHQEFTQAFVVQAGGFIQAAFILPTA